MSSDTASSQDHRLYDEPYMEISQEVRYETNRLTSRLQLQRGSNHESKTIMVLIQVPECVTAGSINKLELKELLKMAVTSLYFFKLRYPHDDGWNFGLYLSVNGYCTRAGIQRFVKTFLTFIMKGGIVSTMTVRPKKGRRVAVYDYVQSLYGPFCNLLIDFQRYEDLLPEATTELQQALNHTEIQKLVKDVKRQASEILDNILSVPAFYKDSTLWMVLKLDKPGYKEYMRQSSMNALVFKICQDAYGYALNKVNSKHMVGTDECLIHHTIQRSIINRLSSETVFKRVQQVIAQYFGATYIHPHPLSTIKESRLGELKAFDGMVLSPRFMISLLMCARWFAKVCMQDFDTMGNNRANLILYGQSGAGKTLILSALSAFMPTYRYLMNGRFQNPEIMSAAIMYFDEMDTSLLVTNAFKSILDVKQSVKMDFKNAHPVNATEGMVAVISTNDSVYQTIREGSGGGSQMMRSRQAGYQHPNEHSVDAALRRLYIVPMQFGIFAKVHGNIIEDECVTENRRTVFAQTSKFNGRFEKEEDLLGKLFNLIFCIACMQKDVENMKVGASLCGYANAVLGKFRKTLWYSFMTEQADFLQSSCMQIEELMGARSVSDTEYVKLYHETAISLEYKAMKFMRALCKQSEDPILVHAPLVVKDPKCPWSLKYYYIMQSVFVASSPGRAEAVPLSESLNSTIAAAINSGDSMPYHPSGIVGDLEECKMDSDDDSDDGNRSISEQLFNPGAVVRADMYDDIERVLQVQGRRTFAASIRDEYAVGADADSVSNYSDSSFAAVVGQGGLISPVKRMRRE